MTRTAAHRRRHGFTLVELLVVLAIIALLVALLIPAIAGAVKTAKSAAVQAEINTIAQALSDFKSKMGDYPPSRIILNESGAVFPTSTTAVATTSGATGDVTQGQLYQRTMTAFRKFWPRVVLTNGAVYWAAGSTNWYDFNGDGVYAGNTPFYVQGHQCLVFFLGGIPMTDTTTNTTLGMSGFSKSPTNPFQSNLSGSTNYNANRNPPFFEFSAGRLAISDTTTLMPGYTDTLNPPPGGTPNPAFYAYFSTNNGVGYDSNDMNVAEPDSTGAVTAINLTFTSNQSLSGGGSVTHSPSPNPYTTTAPTGGVTVVYQNAQSFQIISPGVDNFYGVGGAYLPNSINGVLPAENGISNSTDPQLRVYEQDNLTNFHNGKLQ